MSDTPRTDAEEKRINESGCLPECDSIGHAGNCPFASPEVQMADFARELERELTAARAEVERLQSLAMCVYCGHHGPKTEIVEHVKVCEKHPLHALKAEVEKLKAYAQMADERLCKFTHGEMTVEQRDEINAVINILKRARYGDDSIFRDVKLEKIIRRSRPRHRRIRRGQEEGAGIT